MRNSACLVLLLACLAPAPAMAQDRLVTPRDAQDPEAVGRLTKMLGDKDSSKRLSAVRALTKSSEGSEVAIKALAEHCLVEQDPEVIFELSMFFSVNRPGLDSTVPIFMRALEHDRAEVRRVAAVALSQLGEKAPLEVIPHLVELLKAENSMVRVEGIISLMRVSSRAPDSAIQALAARCLVEKDPLVLDFMFSSLGGLNDRLTLVVPTLKRALEDEDGRVRMGAALTLCELGSQAPPEIVPVLTKLLQGSGSHRMAGASALGKLGAAAAEAVEPLIACVQSDKHGWGPRTAAANALGAIGPLAKAAIPSLLTLLEAKPVRRGRHGLGAFIASPQPTALVALLAIDPEHEQMLPVLRRAITEGDREMWAAADAALKNLGPRAKQLVPTLIACLEPGDGNQRVDALKAGAIARMLGNLGKDGADAVPALTKLVEQSAPLAESGMYRQSFACMEAMKALGAIGKPAAAAVPVLEKVQLSKSEALAQTAKETLGKLRD